MALTNPFIGYLDRSFLTIKQSILTRIANPVTGIPEITDHSDSNPFVKRVSIWAGIAEMLGYYIDNMAKETFVHTADLYESFYRLSKAYDYRIRGRIPASGTINITLNNPAPYNITIPSETEVQTSEGIKFLTLSSAVIVTGQTNVSIPVKQWTKVVASVIAISDGSQNQVYELNENVVDKSINIIVDNTIPYINVDSFVRSLPLSYHFIAGMNENAKMQIVFGDDINGAIPLATKDIKVGWYETSGRNGNVGSGLINTINSVLTLPTGFTASVTNLLAITNGTNAESITELRKYIPLSLRTLYRAVTRQDYIDVAELIPGVAKAGLEHSCGKTVDIYIAPNGGGAPSPTLLTDAYDFMELRKMITTKHRIFGAGQVIIKHLINVRSKPQYFNVDTYNEVKEAVENFYNVENQTISGKVHIGDIYQLIEGLPKVEYSTVGILTPVPYARPLDTGYPILDWAKEVLISSQNATYKLVFTTSTQFNLVRNNVFVNSYSVGVLVTTNDLKFTVFGTYTIGNKYEFKTYNYNSGSVDLAEPSLPVFDITEFELNVTGGLV
ncbi:MAG TPA: baseplate J/gp47 family protein [Bacteroidia bacterium]|nr:baseplate J/gp47 family protein [Bacteroidia bacterium]HOZ90673.1 baseplate J/gp47 family protein [Bacteroidia bacterium]HRB52111.1 baseplate J/gp47 family protein [Bacteroidia bacterium]